MADNRTGKITEVINAYSKRLMGFIRRRVNSEEDAEDILQDVFYQFIGNTEPIEQLTGWLFRVTRNKITDRQRKLQPELIEDVYGNNGEDDNEWTDWAELFSDAASNPETEYLRGLFWETLKAALEELPETQKQVFVWHEMEGLSYKDIAQQTGETVNTLLSRKRYAVLHLRDRLSVLRNELLNY